jgi:tetratricopeptide (TPR) repeat protein
MEHHRLALEIDPLNADAHFELGELLSATGQLVESLTHYDRSIEIRPAHGVSRLRYATVLMRLERYAEAKASLEVWRSGFPNDRRSGNALARLLAAAPDRTLRDGPRSLTLAAEVFESERVPPYAETLAMALAEVGRFGDAVELQRRVLAEARRLGQEEHSSRLVQNLDRYESGQVCCASPSDVLPPR